MKLSRKLFHTFRLFFFPRFVRYHMSLHHLGSYIFQGLLQSSVPLVKHYKSFLMPYWVRPRKWSVWSSIKHSLGLQVLAEDLLKIILESLGHTEPVCMRGQQKICHQVGPICCNKGKWGKSQPQGIPRRR